MSQTITLKQIADIAGVSVATVSYALNGSKKVSQKTRLLVLSIAKELDYTPNILAKQLRTDQSKLIFALTNNFSSTFNGAIMQHVEEEFEKEGYQLLALTGDIPEVIKTNIFNGGIVLNYQLTPTEVDQLAKAVKKPLVLLSGDFSGDSVASVSMDNELGMSLIMSEIQQSIHHNICFIKGPDSSFNNKERMLYAEKYYKELFNRDDFTIRTYDGDFQADQAYHLARELLANTDYNAFVCFNDFMTTGIYQAAYEQNLIVGKDISVTGFDNSFYAKTMTPRLTTISLDKRLWAKEVVKTYFGLVNHQQYEHTRIPVHLKKRLSINYGD
ncbi:LacI family DNA-binding transcriptional regulator [Carnobacterium gallinarum]|uniref:LacI family DNA-binding transcriptional regulator n=1 Tax=Carnobacterium gallinarum TaxID=2749 RepID=UPI000556EB4D|nr:LacI family DNA-binding transcriptional regulator [Carnobacterium gallinarum]